MSQFSRHRVALLLALLALPAFGLCAHATVAANPLFSSEAVLQRGIPIPVWGTADEGEQVTVTLAGETAQSTAKNGSWQVTLPPLPAGGPYTMTIAGPANTLTLTDVYVGEVWICSGQSNMTFAVANASNGQDLEKQTDPQLHLFRVANAVSDTPLKTLNGTWTSCANNVPGGFSAVGYVFGRELRKALNVPVGMIESSVGGTVAQSWTSNDALSKNPAFQHFFDEYTAAQAGYPAVLQDFQTKLPDLQTAYAAAKAKYDTDYAAAKAQYDADVATAKANNTALPPAPVYPPAPRQPAPPPDPAKTNNWHGHLYNGMIAPLVPYGIAGAIWYQGESNAGHPGEYRILLPTMIADWRSAWNEGNFPFIIVQLPPIGDPAPQTPTGTPHEAPWAQMREAQRLMAVDDPKVGLAVTTDISDEIILHPTKKEPVGIRAGLVARGQFYGEKVPYLGPQFAGVTPQGGSLVVHFTSADGLTTSDNAPPRGFQVEGADGKWAYATATINGTGVTLTSPDVAAPVNARMGWDQHPVLNLVNGAGLGAGTFSSDDSAWIHILVAPAPAPAQPQPAVAPAPAPAAN